MSAVGRLNIWTSLRTNKSGIEDKTARGWRRGFSWVKEESQINPRVLTPFLRPGFRVSRIAARHQFPCSRDLVIIPFCVITHDNYKYHILLKSNEMDISTP